jgi:glycine oxidase
VSSWDVIIAGAGLAGITAALELCERRAKVLVVERGEAGREASSAAAGMLAPSDPETPPALQAMALESAHIYPEFVDKLQRSTGIRVDFRRQGTIVLGENAPPANYQKLSGEELHRIEPGLLVHELPAFLVAEDSVDPVLLMQAAIRAAELAGIEIRTNVTVQQMRWKSDRVEVATDRGTLMAQSAVNCMGAWSGAPVKPRKGQMLYLQPSKAGLVQHVVRAPGAYIVPRSSGKILVGTTVEDVGFDKSVRAETIQAMHNAAAKYLPELAKARVTDTWAGLRPGSPDDLPLIGPTEERNVFIASGLFRNGILLAPLAAKATADLVMGRRPEIDITAFSPFRFATAWN